MKDHSTDTLIRNAASGMLIIVVFSSAIMSWEGLVGLGRIGGMGWTAFLLPLAIDGALLLGSLEKLHAILGKRQSSYGGLLTLLGVSLSIGGNMVAAMDRGVLAASIHAIPPLMLFVSLGAFERVVKHRIVIEHAEEKRKARKVVFKSQIEQNAPVKSQSEPLTEGRVSVKKAESIGEGVALEHLHEVLQSVPEEFSKAAKVEAMLTAYPDARTGSLSEALGVHPKSVSTTISRVRKRLSEEMPVGSPA